MTTMTELERASVDALLGALPRRPGVEEEILAGSEVLAHLARLFEHMTALGISQAELARRMGRDRRQIHRWFRGDGAITAETLIALGRHVGLRFDAKWDHIEPSVALATGCDAAPARRSLSGPRGLPNESWPSTARGVLMGFGDSRAEDATPELAA
jgi:plasmid maintenance system antidote protein VapI